MRSLQQTTINGWQVSSQKLPMLRGLELKFKIGEAVAPLLANVAPLLRGFDGDLTKINLKAIDVEQAAPVIGAVLKGIKPSEVPGLISEILQTTSITMRDEHNQLNKIDLCDAGAIDRVFHSERTLFEVVWFALKVQFADFFGGSALGQSARPIPTL